MDAALSDVGFGVQFENGAERPAVATTPTASGTQAAAETSTPDTQIISMPAASIPAPTTSATANMPVSRQSKAVYALKAAGEYDTGITLEADCPILLLVTGSYHEAGNRFVVAGELKEEYYD